MQEKNSNSVTQELPQKVSYKGVKIGALLVNARKAAALNQADVAEQINLPKSIIKALEEDDFDKLPESTYVRGYLRNYARVVNIDADNLIELYTDQYQQEPEVEQSRHSSQSYDPAILWSTAAVLSILVGLVITWWFDNHQLPEQVIELVTNQVVVEQETAENKAASSTQSSSVNGSNKNSTVDAPNTPNAASQESQVPIQLEGNEQDVVEVVEISDSEAITADQQQAMEVESQNPTLISSVNGADVITVTYMEKSWTEIRDADANTLIQGLIEPGVVRNLSGKPPFEIFLGNAPGVVIEVNGLYFDHSQYNRSNRTARFQVSSGSLN